MENYTVEHVMGPGLFGTQQLVQDNTTGLEVTMKTIECLDEGRANLALKEILSLLTLRHPYIANYRKLFVTWDHAISSVFLCLVSNHPFLDSLDTLIQSHRQRQSQINSRVFRRLLGQMVDALAYLHKRNIIHRNVKPSNILLVGENQFQLCDFISCSLTKDRMKLSIKATSASKRWMAPESVYDYRWTEKSDIWSLGCVLLDMLTCHVLDEHSSVSQLLRLRQNQSPLAVIQHPGMQEILSIMVQYNPVKRANIWALVNEDLVKAILLECGSSLAYMKKSLPHGVSGPPFDQGPDRVLEFMKIYVEVESVQTSVLTYLLSHQDFVTSKSGELMDVVTTAMQTHQDCVDVQTGACQVILAALSGEEEGSVPCVLPEELPSMVLAAVLTYPEHAKLLTSAFQLLGCPTAVKQTAECALVKRVSNEVIGALRRLPKQREVVLSCCVCLRGLLATGSLAVEGAVGVLCTAAETHMQDHTVLESVCSSLWALAKQGMRDQKDVVDCVLLMIHILKNQQIHAEPHSRLVSNALQALSCITRNSVLAANRILLAPDGGRGLALIKEVIACYRGDAEVILGVCCLLASMSKHGDIAVKLVEEKIPEELALIEELFNSNREILPQIKLALVRLKCPSITASGSG